MTQSNPPGYPPTWPRGIQDHTIPATQVQTGGAPAWLQQLITAGRGVVWLDRLGGWALSSAEPRPAHAGYLGRCDRCRHPLGCIAYVGADHGVYCGLVCLDAAHHTCGDCGGDLRQGSDPAFGPAACSHGGVDLSGLPAVTIPAVAA